MSDVVAFLRARLDEDEAVAQAAWCKDWRFEPNPQLIGGRVLGLGSAEIVNDWTASAYRSVSYHIARHDPARVLREVEAKRRILWLYEGGDAYERSVVEAAVEAMAAIYADRPDCLDEWKPTRRQES